MSIGLLVLALTDSLPLQGLIFSPLGAIGFFIFVFSFIFMAIAQLRHAVWDQGAMFKPELNNALTYGMILLSFVLAVLSTLAAVGAA